MAESKFEAGDHLWKKGGRFGGKLYDHHLIYKEALENGKHVIIECSFRAYRVVQKVLTDSQLQSYYIYERPDDPAACLMRAEAKLGERYNLLTNNCETFGNYCVRGSGESRQVRIGIGHFALMVSTCLGAATAISVGLVTTHTVTIIVKVPATGCCGLWGKLGFTTHQVSTQTYTSTDPLGVAAASGSACCGLSWCGFTAMFRRDPRKRTSKRFPNGI
mmetsp:Transcript_12758/g.20656  ORF Transcript_12758/g.20656 Transcript_12758/m.20656 type:complete len:218 (-) Transcript_12758:194-847(-)